MREKSGFITFMLSFIPGLSHFYLGLRERALIFMMVFFGAIVGVTGLAFVVGQDDVFILLLFGLPLIWLISLMDAFSARKDHIIKQYNGEVEYKDIEEINKSNKKTITLALSIIPGAGHMYLGYQKKGLSIMGIFLFSIFFMG